METRPPRKTFSLRALLPSSLISMGVHITVLLLVGLSFRGCDHGPPVQAGGQNFREIGLAIVNDNSTPVSDLPAQNPQDTDVVQPAVPEPQAPQRSVVPTEVPNVSELLNQNRIKSNSTDSDSQVDLSNTVGPGRPIGGLPEVGGGLVELIRPQGTSGQGSSGSLTPGPGQTSFMDVVGNGRSFVYVIDTSSSMSHGQRLELAKSQLKGSLRLLKPNQRFQVLFYNQSVTQMQLRRRAAEDMYVATTVHVQLAAAEIDRVTANSGTAHLPAIERALLLMPDVIYFLTDGDQPSLSAEQLAQIRKRNAARTQIHVIEFASGARESRNVTWLQQLASQSGGQYRYIPVR